MRFERLFLDGVEVRFYNFWAGFNPRDFIVSEYLAKSLYCFPQNQRDSLEGKVITLWNFGKKYRGRQLDSVRKVSDFVIGFSWESPSSTHQFEFEIGHCISGSPGSFSLSLFDGRVLQADAENLERCQTWMEPRLLTQQRVLEHIPSGFVAAVFSNRTTERLSAIAKLEDLGKVDVFGREGLALSNKRELFGHYRYILAFENTSQEGYVTEKLYDAYTLNSIPIYWGHPATQSNINSKSFLLASDEDHFDSLLSKVRELEENPEKYNEIYSQPLLYSVPDYSSRFTELIERLIAQTEI